MGRTSRSKKRKYAYYRKKGYLVYIKKKEGLALWSSFYEAFKRFKIAFREYVELKEKLYGNKDKRRRQRKIK